MLRVAIFFSIAFLASRSLAKPDEPVAENPRIQQWIAQLQNDDVRTQWYAAYALGQAGPDSVAAIEPLMTILANLSGHEYVRGTAAWALGRIGPEAEQAAPLLIETLESAHLAVRRNSPLALARIGRPAAMPAVPRLIELLSDPDAEVRVNSATALWQIDRQERAIAALGKILTGSERGAYEAAVALGQLDAPPEEVVLDALVRAFASEDATVRRAAARSAGTLGKTAIPRLATVLDHTSERVRQTAVEAFSWMGPQAVAPLIVALQNDSSDVRRAAARALGRMGPAAVQAESALVAALNDPQGDVRQAVAWAIGRVRAEP